ncbi:MAG: c-type cytochrome [Chloroflexi bacterium]|nr:c-type cytochrome [Chloroflexota bacterium]
MKKSWVLMVILVLGAILLAACGGGNGGGTATRPTPPPEFAQMTNPMEGQADAATAGQEAYATNCASCHGNEAAGDGPAAGSLDPKPANLQNTAAETEPQYMYWVISEGGAAAGLSASMPAFEGVLSEDAIWQIVTYLETTYGQ